MFGDDGFLRAWGAAWSAGTPDDLFDFYTGDARYRDVGSDLTFVGHDQIATFFHYMLKFAPDSAIDFDAAHGDATGFAAHWTWSGTAAGPLRLGAELLPATGRAFAVSGIAWCALGEDGRIAVHEDYYDMRAVVAQVTA